MRRPARGVSALLLSENTSSGTSLQKLDVRCSNHNSPSAAQMPRGCGGVYRSRFPGQVHGLNIRPPFC